MRHYLLVIDIKHHYQPLQAAAMDDQLSSKKNGAYKSIFQSWVMSSASQVNGSLEAQVGAGLKCLKYTIPKWLGLG